jgi:hypothetical protein
MPHHAPSKFQPWKLCFISILWVEISYQFCTLLTRGQSEPEAINAPVARSVHWMGCVFSLGTKWGSYSPFLFATDHCIFILFYFLFLAIFLWTWPHA